MKKKRTLSLIYMGLITAVMYLPVAVVAVYSFNESRVTSVWSGFSLKWYRELFRDDSVIEALTNSLVLGFASSLLAAVISVSAVLAMKKRKLPLAGAVSGISMIPIMIPEIILGVVYLAFFRLLGIPFGMITLILAHTAFSVPYVFIQVRARAASMDTSALDAARDLGAGPVRAFFDVTLPFLSPAILSGMLLSFAMSFDDVIISMFVTGVSVNTLPLKVYSQLKTSVTPKTNAICTVILAVTLLSVALAAIIKKISKKKGNQI